MPGSNKRKVYEVWLVLNYKVTPPALNRENTAYSHSHSPQYQWTWRGVIYIMYLQAISLIIVNLNKFLIFNFCFMHNAIQVITGMVN